MHLKLSLHMEREGEKEDDPQAHDIREREREHEPAESSQMVSSDEMESTENAGPNSCGRKQNEKTK